jgi:hypothetical protein
VAGGVICWADPLDIFLPTSLGAARVADYNTELAAPNSSSVRWVGTHPWVFCSVRHAHAISGCGLPGLSFAINARSNIAKRWFHVLAARSISMRSAARFPRISDRFRTSDDISALATPRIARTPSGLMKTCSPKASPPCRTIASACCTPATNAVKADGPCLELGVRATSIGCPRLMIRSTSLEGSPK